MPEDLTLLSTTQAAELLCLSKTWLEQARLVSKGPAFVRVGKHVRYRLSDIRDFLTANAVEMVAK